MSFFFGKKHLGAMLKACIINVAPFIFTLSRKTKLKYVVTLSPLRDHLKTKEMKIKTLSIES